MSLYHMVYDLYRSIMGKRGSLVSNAVLAQP